jgi:hypothetical protein
MPFFHVQPCPSTHQIIYYSQKPYLPNHFLAPAHLWDSTGPLNPEVLMLVSFYAPTAKAETSFRSPPGLHFLSVVNYFYSSSKYPYFL